MVGGEKRSEPSTAPCGTPLFKTAGIEVNLLLRTEWWNYEAKPHDSRSRKTNSVFEAVTESKAAE